MNKNDENNQNIHKACYDLGSMFEKSSFIHMMTWRSNGFEKSRERTIFKCLKQIKKKFFTKIPHISKNKHFCDLFVE